MLSKIREVISGKRSAEMSFPPPHLITCSKESKPGNLVWFDYQTPAFRIKN